MSGQYPSFNQPITLHPIGVIHSPHEKAEETPIQPVYARGIEGSAEILPQYADGLRDLENFSHIYLLYHFHKAKHAQMIVQPFLEDTSRGLFATRSPRRPNPIGFSVVRLARIERNILHLQDVDVLDGTPLLDIKPYISRFDHHKDTYCGWQSSVDEETAQARGRRKYRKSAA